MSLVFVIFVYLLLPSNVKIVDDWWKTALKGRNLVNLTPSQENTPMIPFLQMANGRTNRVGCAYEWCVDDYDDINARPYPLFVCRYGEEKIRIGHPIYHIGPPCDTCRNRCTFNNRLCKS
ncbi:hypothetical protein DICVIV_09630 [Dictyocaulus viviparus]|uniref:SCP domain-containing protein n=1 Tax=Dictyocaulus viviparus TaxID=29172 RepID=A0A0D8XKJ9_DICVI|nr:hypothetical protein DICVIV_09630 [Dictyocaulus viviparus]